MMGNNGGAGNRFGPLPMMLPFLENGPLYNLFNYNLDVDDAAQHTGRGVQINVFLCPSDDASRQQSTYYHQFNAQYAYSAAINYGASMGPSYQLYGKWDGLFTGNGQPISIANVTDGTSQTAAFAEFLRAKRDDPVSLPDLRRGVYDVPTSSPSPDGGGYNNASYVQFVGLCKSMTPATAGTKWGFRGWYWTYGNIDSGAWYTHVLPPNSNVCQNKGDTWRGNLNSSSNHKGIANVLFTDGTVRGIKETIDEKVWVAIGSRDGGESVNDADIR